MYIYFVYIYVYIYIYIYIHNTLGKDMNAIILSPALGIQ